MANCHIISTAFNHTLEENAFDYMGGVIGSGDYYLENPRLSRVLPRSTTRNGVHIVQACKAPGIRQVTRVTHRGDVSSLSPSGCGPWGCYYNKEAHLLLSTRSE